MSELFLANTRKGDFSKTLYEILTPTERLMLAKRIGIVGMLIGNYSSREISLTFKVSTSTVANIQKQIEDRKFDHVATIFKNKEYRKSFFGVLETLVTVGGIGQNSQKKLRNQLRRDMEAFKAGG